MNLLAVNGQDFISGLQATAIGIGLVFLILGLLILIIYLSKLLVRFIDNKIAPRFAKKKLENNASSESSDEAIIAAITAAVAMVYSEEAKEHSVQPLPFVIRDIRYIK